MSKKKKEEPCPKCGVRHGDAKEYGDAYPVPTLIHTLEFWDGESRLDLSPDAGRLIRDTFKSAANEITRLRTLVPDDDE